MCMCVCEGERDIKTGREKKGVKLVENTTHKWIGEGNDAWQRGGKNKKAKKRERFTVLSEGEREMEKEGEKRGGEYI